ncbi:nucleotidyltransferase [Niallia sp.]|uniref:nucleotidyltransferase n=1 Tax=Niallia sp. TaxID=2837523 RepID=UPI0028A0572C|nr:nucleotidyltransferase [Niallia sp.]
MKAVGVVVEYNPFHNGHLYHIQKAKELTDADIVVAVMSGPFLQRGEPALVSKWSRAEMALENGIDLIVELPYSFATQHAAVFAAGSVEILQSLGCDFLCFGSESGDITEFSHMFNQLQEKQVEEDLLVKESIKKGMSYPKAKSLAIQELTNIDKTLGLDLSMPNNILGYEYYKAVHTNNYPIEVCTVARMKADYHDKIFTSDTIASATSIRQELVNKQGSLKTIEPFLPPASFYLLQKYEETYQTYHTWENYWGYLKFRILQSTAKELATIYEMEEGLEYRFLKYVKEASSFEEYIRLLKTKRYTWTRLQRICVHILTNAKKEEMLAQSKPAYMRLLGTTENGRFYLKEKKKQFSLPIISKLSAFDIEKIALDIRASQIYALGAAASVQEQLLNMDYAQPPIMK